MEKVDTPVLDRMLEINEQSRLCGEFLDYFLSRYTVFDRTKGRDGEDVFADVVGSGDYVNKEKLLAGFFGIDLEEAEREKERLLRSVTEGRALP